MLTQHANEWYPSLMCCNTLQARGSSSKMCKYRRNVAVGFASKFSKWLQNTRGYSAYFFRLNILLLDDLNMSFWSPTHWFRYLPIPFGVSPIFRRTQIIYVGYISHYIPIKFPSIFSQIPLSVVKCLQIVQIVWPSWSQTLPSGKLT